jgi:hypothetical protein
MSRARAGTALALLLFYAGLALLFTYPLPWHFTTHHLGEPGGDGLVYQWNLWWVRQAILESKTTPFESNVIFYPVGIGLSLHTLGFLHGLLFIPLSEIFGRVSASNLILLATFVASALGAYALARYLGAGRAGALLAGLAFGFCPYRLARLAGHYDLLSTEWLPLFTLAWLKAMDAPKRRWAYLLAAALAAAACGYTVLTYLVFLGLFSLVHLLWRWVRERRLGPRLVGRATIVALATALFLSPLLSAIYRDLTQWRYLPYPGSDRYVADLAAWVLPGAQQTLIGPSIGRAFDRNITETTVFPGYLVLALVVAALASRRLRAGNSLWFLVAGVGFILSLGSTLHLAGRSLGVPLPFALLANLPLTEHLRAPSRFAILVVLSLSLILAASWTYWTGRWRRSTRIVFTAAAAGVLVAEFLATPIPLFAARVSVIYEKLGSEPGDFTVVEIPGIDQDAGRIMYHQTVHGKRIFIGTAARVPPEKTAYYFGLPLIRPLVDLRKGKLELSDDLVAEERRSAPAVARFLGIRYFVVDRAYEKRGVLGFLKQVLPLETAFEDGERVALRVREEELPANPWSIDPAGPPSRLHFETGWSLAERAEGRAFRWANDARSRMLLRRPAAGPLVLVLELARLPRLEGQWVEATWNGWSLGRRAVAEHWSEIRFPLPAGPDGVARLELRWARAERASERDTRRLAARIAGIRFEPAP